MYSKNFEEYHKHLLKKSSIGRLYRKYYLFRRISKHLTGLCLDVGCGTGDFVLFRQRTIGADINPFNIELLKSSGREASLITNNKLDFSSNFFDSVLLDNVLEHIEYPDDLILEILRVLKPDGTLLVGVPGILGFNTEVDHKIYYDLKTLEHLFTKHKFELRYHFYTPFQFEYFNQNLKQYCLYAKFKKKEFPF